jgi:very-short-patch-repair endonuclease
MLRTSRTDIDAEESPAVVEPSIRRIAAVAAAAKGWADQLIDLGGRNTLLYYRDLKAGTLDLTTAEAVALEAFVGVQGQKVRLSALFPGERLANAATRVRTLSAKADENFEERGLSTLYVARGMATWDAQGATGATPAAPVLLAQVTLHPEGALETDFTLAIDDEWEPNPTLLHMLETSFHVRISADDLLGAIERAAGDLNAASTALVQAASSVPSFKVLPRTVVGNFSYVKQPMVLDLESALEVMCSNDVIAALAGDQEAIAKLRSAHLGVGIEEPDRTPPTDEFLVIDADSSQNYAINAAADGAHLVVQGPPGTGKSQTIANLIAVLSARGRSTLFVAEKRAAIDAVLKRLMSDSVNLGDLVLDLHGGGGSRRKMADEIRRVYDATSMVPAVHREREDARLVELRSKLNHQVDVFHKVKREPWGKTVYELQSSLLNIPQHLRLPLRLEPSCLSSLDPKALSQVANDMSDWVATGGPDVDRGGTPWSRAASTITTSSSARAALMAARNLATDTLPDAISLLDEVAATCHLRHPTSVAGWSETLGLLQQVAVVDQRAETSVWEQDLDLLLSDLKPATTGLLGRATALVFNRRYRHALRQVRAFVCQISKSRDIHGIVSVAATAKAAWKQTCVDGGQPRLPQDLARAVATYQRLTTELAALGAYVGTAKLAEASLLEARRAVNKLLEDEVTLFRLPKLHELATSIDAAGFAAVRASVSKLNLSPEDARLVVDHVWNASVLEQISLADGAVGAFNGDTHSRYVREFAEADKSLVESGAAKVRRAVHERIVAIRNAHPEEDALIATEVRKKSRHRSLRELTQRAPKVLLALKPCWAMSPLAVSQLLDAKELFDVVIFDEASQVPPADALPALMRARQAIVAGDSKQLPPTAFFASPSAADEGIGDENGIGDLTVGTQSILDAIANVVTAGAMTLKWHYRSRDERLITFSNAQPLLYDWQMVTFPGTTEDDAIRHVHVPWRPLPNTSEDSSPHEAIRVVELIAEHSHRWPDRSLGVIAMGIEHAERIKEMLRRACLKDPVLDNFHKARHPDEPLFVKNLERVQGDERSAIILTIGYGKSSDGRMLHRFGPLNHAEGERRLNVAITRARSQMTVVSSFLSTDLDPNKLKSEGAQMLGRYLAYAASGGKELGPVRRKHAPLNPFEADIRDRLQAAKIPLDSQLGVSGYFIDFAARHPERPGEFVLAIEADGDSYHRSHTARDRDRIRQDHLERLGWRFHRIWSSDWFRNREAEIDKAVSAWKAACADADRKRRDVAARSEDTGIRPLSASPGVLLPRPPVSPLPLESAGQRTGIRPRITSGEPITEYSDAEVVDIVTWVASDGLLRTDTELRDLVAVEMGYQRLGLRIRQRLESAIAQFRR